MWNISVIEDLKKNAAKDAKENRVLPILAEEFLTRFKDDGIYSIPFISDYVPEGWQRESPTLFVDLTGFGDESEPALTWKQTEKKIKAYALARQHFAFAFVEVGQFQGVVGVFRPDHRDFTHTGNLTEEELNTIGGK